MAPLYGYDPTPYDSLFTQYGTQYGIDPGILRTQANIESAFNPRAVSPVGAKGIAQFMPATGREFGLLTDEDFFDPEKNIRAQAQYMRQLLDRYQDRGPADQLKYALTAYNAGMGNVERKGAYDWDEPTAYRQRFESSYVLPPGEAQKPSLLPSGGGGDQEDFLSVVRREAASRSSGGFLDQVKAYAAQQPQKESSFLDQVRSYAGQGGDARERLRDEALIESTPAGPIETFDISQAAQELDLRLGSQAFSEFVAQHGGLPSLTPSRVVEGDPLAGTTERAFGVDTEVDYPIPYKARIEEVIDADTVKVKEMGTGDIKTVRFADIDAAEKGTPEGDSAAEILSAGLAPGTQVTVTGQGADWTGKHGRELGKVFLSTGHRADIDLSKPVITGEGAKEYGREQPGVFKAFGASLARELGDIAMMPEDLWNWIEGKLDPEHEENVRSKLYQRADELTKQWKQVETDFVTGDYNPDDITYDLPFLGKVTLGELGAASLSSTGYAVGATGVLGPAFKLLKALAKTGPLMKAITSLETGEDIAKNMPLIKKMLLKRMDDADAARQVLDGLVDTRGLMDKERAAFVLDVLPKVKGESAVGKIRRFAQAFQANWFDVHSSFNKLARKAHRTPEMDLWLNQLKAGDDLANSPFAMGVQKWVPDENGTMVPKIVSEPMNDIWQGKDAGYVDDGMAWMAYNQATSELIPRWEFYMAQAGGKFSRAKALAEEAGESIVDFTKADVEGIRRAEARIQQYYSATPGAFEDLVSRVNRQREFYRAASLDVIYDVGGIDTPGYARAVKVLGNNYAPFSRADLEILREVMGETFVADLKAAEDVAEKVAKQTAEKGAGTRGRPHDPTPLARRKHGLGEDIRRKIENPMPVMMRRTVAIHKWANRQRVRNMVGEMIDELGNVKGVTRITDPTDVARMVNITPENGIVAFHKEANGAVRKVGYLFEDAGLARAASDLNPGQMQMLGGMLKQMNRATGFFRKMTVLGLSFIVRNPMRDQFMAAALSKYGYVPVTDWFRGLYHVARNSPVYRATKHMGGSQSDEVTNYLGHNGENFALNLNDGERISDLFKVLDDPDLTGIIPKAKAFLTQPNLISSIPIRTRNSAKGVRKGRLARETKIDRNRLVHFLATVSRSFEEGTRVGAAARAVKRAKKGKRYGLLRALDEAAGGFTGWARMMGSREARKGFFTRLDEARHLTKEQKAARMGPDGILWDADIMDEVRNITLDFARHGKYGETLNSLYPFFNAELQDMWRFGKAFRDAPLSTMTKAFTYITLPAIANWYLNFDNPKYHAQGQIEKDLYLHPFGFNEEYKKFGRIPRPLGTINGTFGLAIHKMLDFLAVNDPEAIKSIEEMMWPGKSARHGRDLLQETMHETKEGMGQGLLSTLGALTMGMSGLDTGGPPIPIEDRIDGDPLLKDLPWMDYVKDQVADYATTNTVARYFVPQKPGTFVAQIAPHAIKPLASIAENWDTFFNAPITPPRMQMAGMENEDIYTETTSPIERLASRLLNGTPLLNKLDVNPIEAGYLIRAYSGSVGSMAIKWADMGAQALGIFPERPSHVSDWTDHPGLGGLYGSEPWGSNSAPVRALYEEWEKVSKTINSLEYAKHAQNRDRLIDIMQSHPELAPAKILQQATSELAEFHKLRRRKRSDETLTKEERVDVLMQIDQLMTLKAYQYMNAYNKIRRSPSLMAAVAGIGE
jgi:endonuclease YncB( thermonuclease family)